MYRFVQMDRKMNWTYNSLVDYYKIGDIPKKKQNWREMFGRQDHGTYLADIGLNVLLINSGE
jgi:hypothetical protein